MDKLLEKALNMIEAGEVRVVLQQFDTNLDGFVIENNCQKVIVLNSCLTYERQREKFLHEVKHLDDLCTDKDVELCEYEATNYSSKFRSCL